MSTANASCPHRRWTRQLLRGSTLLPCPSDNVKAFQPTCSVRSISLPRAWPSSVPEGRGGRNRERNRRIPCTSSPLRFVLRLVFAGHYGTCMHLIHVHVCTLCVYMYAPYACTCMHLMRVHVCTLCVYMYAPYACTCMHLMRVHVCTLCMYMYAPYACTCMHLMHVHVCTLYMYMYAPYACTCMHLIHVRVC